MLRKIVFITSLLFGCLSTIFAQEDDWNHFDSNKVVSIDSVKEKGITLVFANNDKNFDPAVKQKMMAVFFDVYPKERKLYNKNTRKKVTIFIDTAYKSVAATGGGLMRVNPEWMHKHPDDLDVVTHEAMHVVQEYPRYEPIWVTEGIADYVRATLGVYNKEANWKLPEYNAKQSYTNSYRITARFFIWLEKNKKKGLVKKLDHVMRTNAYTDDFWKENTDETVDQLWADYGKNPTL